jgi:glutaminyl-tRNA synthetase
MSKRKLLALVEQNLVSGWNDPRMPTIAGLRRRGYTPEAIRDFCTRIGVAKKENVVDVALLEHTVREDLNRSAQRGLAVLRPLKVEIENYPEGQVEYVDAVNNPEDPGAGVRKIPFSRVLYIEADDFMKDPPKKFFRLSPGNEVRLRYAYILKCERVITDSSGVPIELKCTIDTESLSGATASRRVKGTIHWVSAPHAFHAEVRLYDRLFRSEDPAENGRDPLTDLNQESLTVLTGCKVESMLAIAQPGARFQFERQGYFCVDADSRSDSPVFNRTVTLKDTWAKISGKVGK